MKITFELRQVVIDGPNAPEEQILPAGTALQEGDILFNTGRALYGDETWKGTWVSGPFYAIVRAGKKRERYENQRDWMIKENKSLDARVVRLITEEEAKRQLRRNLGILGERISEKAFNKHWFESWHDNCALGKVEIETDEKEPA